MALERRMFAIPKRGAHEFHLVVIGPHGAVEFHFNTTADRELDHDGTFPLVSLGVEMHKRVPADEANHQSCYLLGGEPCFHEGTSLWASEFVMPLFMSAGSDAVFDVLERRYWRDVRDRQAVEPAIEVK